VKVKGESEVDFSIVHGTKDGKIQIGDSSQPQDFHPLKTKVGMKL
jgi:hypothetical protein